MKDTGHRHTNPLPASVSNSSGWALHVALWLSGLGLMVLSLFWAKPAWEMLTQARASSSWPSTVAKIDSARSKYHRIGSVNSAQNYHQPEVRYHYRVNGRRYLGNTIRFADLRFRHRAGRTESQQIISRYNALHTGFPEVDVYYDPEQPERSVLEPGATARSYRQGANVASLFGIGLILIAFDCWLLWPRPVRTTEVDDLTDKAHRHGASG